eukprot:scaffold79700_cov32-Tisochrysis_lutea.AAC.1
MVLALHEGNRESGGGARGPPLRRPIIRLVKIVVKRVSARAMISAFPGGVAIAGGKHPPSEARGGSHDMQPPPSTAPSPIFVGIDLREHLRSTALSLSFFASNGQHCGRYHFYLLSTLFAFMIYSTHWSATQQLSLRISSGWDTWSRNTEVASAVPIAPSASAASCRTIGCSSSLRTAALRAGTDATCSSCPRTKATSCLRSAFPSSNAAHRASTASSPSSGTASRSANSAR